MKRKQILSVAAIIAAGAVIQVVLLVLMPVWLTVALVYPPALNPIVSRLMQGGVKMGTKMILSNNRGNRSAQGVG